MGLVLLLVTCLLALRGFTGARPHDLVDRSTCNLPASSVYTCSNNVVSVNTSQGVIKGQLTAGGAFRFNVKYATAQRFQPPQLTTVSTAFANSTGLPPMCPQTGVDPSEYSEDCLYFVVYAPANLTPVQYSGGAPVMVWIHGGSYVSGSASDPALDASKFAETTGTIVVVVQYRLGILGYLPPASLDANKNLGVRDVIAALQWIQNTVGCMGGDKARVTLAGQSSGGNMIRNLLATPSANNLFSRGILESDPMNYGFLPASTFNNLQASYYSSVNCGNCLTTPLSTLLPAQDTLASNAPSIDPASGFAEPIRPTLDGTLITYSLTTTFPATNKNLLLTTVKDEAGPSIYALIPQLPPSYTDYVDNLLYGSPRDAAVEAQYHTAEDNTDDIRPDLVVTGTDGAWRCPNYSLARAWASRGGNVWVGEFTVGATYPDNTQYSFCVANGAVCHEDDIEIVFGTVPSPTAAQTALIAQVQARWGAFVNYGNPNTSGYANWSQVTHGGSIPVMNLGGTASIPLGACDPSIWGGSIQYDYQIYNE